MKQLLPKIIQSLRTFFTARLNYKSEDLPYYTVIAISFIICAIGLNMFIELTDELHENELSIYDSMFTAHIQTFKNSTLTSFFKVITHLGDRVAYILLIFFLAILFWLRLNNWKYTTQIIIVLSLSSLSNIVLKRVVNRARPTVEHLVSVNTLSFPSGHAMSAMAFYGFLIFLLFHIQVAKGLRIVLVILLAFVILAIGVSRIYLGVHYPSDVAAGFIGGLIWIACSVIIFNVIDLQRKRTKTSNENKVSY